MTVVTKYQDKSLSYIDGIIQLESLIKSIPGALIGDNFENPLKHEFADGCYIRTIVNPSHELIVTKIHKKTHPFFLMEGDMSIRTEEGWKRIKAPYHGITLAGTKRVIYTHAKCVFITVHITNEVDLEKIEKEVIAETFNDVEQNIIDAQIVNEIEGGQMI